MTKILNSLLVAGTGSTNQALGITAGYVSISNKLRIGDWSIPTATLDINSPGTSSSTNAFKISTGYNINSLSPSLSFRDDGVLILTGVGIGYGATNSSRPTGIADLSIGNNYYGSIDLQGYGIFGKDSGGSEGLSFYIRKTSGGVATYSRAFRFYTATDRIFNLTPESDSDFSISYPTYNNGYIRLSSYNDSNKYFKITSDDSTNQHTQIDRFGIQGYTDFASVFFRNTSGVQIDHIKIQSNTTTSATSSSGAAFGGARSHFIIGASGSSNTGTHSINVANGSIFITPFQTITLTASYATTKNTFIGTNINNLPSGSYNIFISGKSSVTTGSANVVIGDYASGNESGGSITTGTGNVVVGAISLKVATTGSHNTAIGYRSLESNTGNSNIGIGYYNGIQSTGASNIFIGNMAGYGQTAGNYITHISSNISEVGTQADNAPRIYRLSSSNRSEYGTLPSWAANANGSNVLMFGSEGNYYGSSNLSSPGTYRTMFFGKGAYHWSSQLYTYVITTAIPAQNYFTSGSTQSFTQSNVDAVGANLELVAGIGRGGGTAGDLYFSTGQLTASGTSSLQDKVNRMTIKGGSGFVGIGPGTFSNSPTTLLHIWGTSSGLIRIQDGTQGAGKVLTSDANGVGTWATSSGSGGGVSGGSASYVPLFFSGTSLTSSNIYQGTSGVILIGYTSSSSTYTTDSNTLRVKGNVYFDYTDLVKAKYYINGTYLFDDVLQNLALGYNALNGNTQSTQTEGSVAIGYESLKNTTTGKFNIGIGYRSLYGITTGQSNVSIGYNSMANATASVKDNIAIGRESLKLTTTNNNIAIGSSAGVDYSATSSNNNGFNTFIGHSSGKGFTEGMNNIFLTNNQNSNIGITGGANNIIIGSKINIDSTSRNGNVIIGSSMSVRSGLTNSVLITDGSGNERLFIDSIGRVTIGETASLNPMFGPITKFNIWNGSGTPTASFRLYDGFQGTGKVLVSDSQGVGIWSTFSEGANYFNGDGLSLSNQSDYYVNGNYRKGFTLSVVTGRGVTISSNLVSLSQNITTKSADFTVQTSEWGYIYHVTTGTNLITVTPPTTTSGFEFTIKKTDLTNGAILVNGVYEYFGSSNLSYITRLGQTIKYVYNGSSWITIVMDDGVLSSNTLLANFSTTYSYADEMAIIDINDPVQETINYNQGSWDYDWMSGVVFSAYRPLSLTNPSGTSMFNTASNNYIGATGSPLTIQSFGMKLGKSFKIQLSGTYSHDANCTFSFYPKIGSVTISSITINNTSTFSNAPFYIDYTFKCLSVGSLGQVHGSGFLMSGNSYNLIMSTSSFFSTIDTTINNNIGLLSTKDAGSTLNLTIIHSTIERLA